MGSGGWQGPGNVTWLLMGVATLVVGVAMTLEVRGALDREREFRAAPACASVPVKASGCRWEQEFTVRKADLNRGRRNGSPEAELLLPSGKPWYVTFRQTDPVVSELEPGERVVGLIWHGQVVGVRDADGRRQQTSHGPVGWSEDRLGGALACFAFGLSALVGGAWPLFARVTGGTRRQEAWCGGTASAWASRPSSPCGRSPPTAGRSGRSRRSGDRSRCSAWPP
ncbi:hypothetical protein SVIOM74S_01989 [Streptomyces violarus]